MLASITHKYDMFLWGLTPLSLTIFCVQDRIISRP